MAQQSLVFTPKSLNPISLTGRVYALLDAHRGQWVDGWRLSEVGGYAGWSARVRDLRKLGYVVENRQRKGTNYQGDPITITEYRLL